MSKSIGKLLRGDYAPMPSNAEINRHRKEDILGRTKRRRPEWFPDNVQDKSDNLESFSTDASFNPSSEQLYQPSERDAIARGIWFAGDFINGAAEEVADRIFYDPYKDGYGDDNQKIGQTIYDFYHGNNRLMRSSKLRHPEMYIQGVQKKIDNFSKTQCIPKKEEYTPRPQAPYQDNLVDKINRSVNFLGDWGTETINAYPLMFERVVDRATMGGYKFINNKLGGNYQQRNYLERILLRQENLENQLDMAEILANKDLGMFALENIYKLND
nr:MAG TPA: hypothetical protein [Caudoviricetes sp.]